MSKPFSYWIRLAFTATLCTLVTFSPVNAGRWMDRLLHRENCKPVAGCALVANPCEPTCEVATPCCAPSAPVASPCDAAPVEIASNCGCDGLVVQPADAVAAPAAVSPLSVEAPSATTPSTAAPSTAAPTVDHQAAPPTAPVKEPTIEKPAPVVIDEPKVSPPKVETPAVAPPVEPAVEPVVEPVVEPDAVPSPFDDVTPAPAEPAGDLFGGDEPEMAAEPANADTLIPQEPDVPAEPAAGDDLFGNAEPAPDAEPAEAMADENAAPNEPAPGLDDLFGGDAAEPAPAEPVADPAQPELDDLFNGNEKPAGDAKEPDLDDLFGKPVSTDSDDSKFFSELMERDRASDSESDTAKEPSDEKTESSEDSLDALFGTSAFAPTSPFNGAEFRQWVDNTGAYQVKARLSVIYSDKVKLLKDNGKFTTVPLSRLSESDFGYVQWVASNLSTEATQKLVKKDDSTANADLTR